MGIPRKSPEERAATRAAAAVRSRERKRLAKQAQLAAEKDAQNANKYADHILGITANPGVLPPKGTDVAKLLQGRYLSIIENLDDAELLNKDFSPGLNVALKAQDIIDKREVRKTKQGNADLAFAIISMLGGVPPPLLLDDGNTVDGEAVEVVDAV